MKKLALLVGISAVAAASQAAINFNLNNQYQTTAAPNAGSIFVTFSGTIQVLLPQFDVTTMLVENPGSASNIFLNVSFDAGFVTYVNGNNPGVGYSGNMFSIEVASTTPNAFYWLNNSGAGMSALSEAIVVASGPGPTGAPVEARDNEFYGVNVVPEPATMTALGIGALALIRKRRKA